MNKQDYVSLQVAKLLKEKGFRQKCREKYIVEDKDKLCQEWDDGLMCYKSFYDTIEYPKPFLYEAQKWIRLRYGIYVYPSVYLSKDNEESCIYTVDSYKYNNNYWETFIINTIKYETYEEALNAGILEVLKLI